MSNDLLADFLAQHAKMTPADMRRFASALLKAAEQKHEAETGKTFPAPTDG